MVFCTAALLLLLRSPGPCAAVAGVAYAPGVQSGRRQLATIAAGDAGYQQGAALAVCSLRADGRACRARSLAALVGRPGVAPQACAEASKCLRGWTPPQERDQQPPWWRPCLCVRLWRACRLLCHSLARQQQRCGGHGSASKPGKQLSRLPARLAPGRVQPCDHLLAELAAWRAPRATTDPKTLCRSPVGQAEGPGRAGSAGGSLRPAAG